MPSPYTPPRYDEVFAEAAAALDELACAACEAPALPGQVACRDCTEYAAGLAEVWAPPTRFDGLEGLGRRGQP